MKLNTSKFYLDSKLWGDEKGDNQHLFSYDINIDQDNFTFSLKDSKIITGSMEHMANVDNPFYADGLLFKNYFL